MNDMEHAALVDSIIKAARGQNADGTAFDGVMPDTIDLIRSISPKITTLRDEAIAEELDRHSAAFWEAAKMLESTFEVLTTNGDEQAAAIVQGQLKTLQDVSGRLSRRAAAVRGISAEELAARALLDQPADTVQPAVPATDELPAVDGLELSRHSGWLITCVECGERAAITGDDVEAEAAMKQWKAEHTCLPGGRGEVIP